MFKRKKERNTYWINQTMIRHWIVLNLSAGILLNPLSDFRIVTTQEICIQVVAHSTRKRGWIEYTVENRETSTTVTSGATLISVTQISSVFFSFFFLFQRSRMCYISRDRRWLKVVILLFAILTFVV